MTFELTPQPNGEVLLILTHRRLADSEEMLDVSGGWHTHLGILADRLHGCEPENFWVTFERLKAHYEKKLQSN